MNNEKLKNLIVNVLKVDDRLWNDEKTELNQTLLLDLVERIDEKIIELFLEDKSLRDKFFIKIKDVYVFKTNDFKFFMEENKVNNSYTQYKNRIGLTDGKRFLKDTNDVVLDFPYKDCVLEGGQSTEEGLDTYFSYEEEKTKTVKGEKVIEEAGYKEKQIKRKEIFFNQVLAQDEIDRLFDEKALVNWKRFTKDGEQEVKEIARDKDGTIKENLIIKGNNLLALHSLKKEFTGKVKLIYIDPPYNTGSDSFKYNDKFNHSSWLTFMKNRLEVARILLNDEGFIYTHCDKNEFTYLKILLDEIFYKDNYIETITVVNNPRGRDYGGVANMHEYIHIYKRTSYAELNPLDNPDKEFPYEDNISGFEPRELRNRNTKFNDKNRPNLVYPFYLNPENKDSNGFFEISLEKKVGWVEVMPKKSQGIQTVWRWGKEKSKENLNINIVGKGMKENCHYQIIEKYRATTRLARSVWWDKEVNSERGTLHLKELFSKKVFDHPKPEETLKRIIEMSTNKGDSVLDYHLGSGTTCAVAHKMGRHYIGIEQMDYIEDIVVKRMEKAIKGEQGGISKAVNWKGGGNFIYCELAKWNEQAKEEINNCDSLDELIKLFDSLYEKYFLNYNLKIKEFKEKVIKEDNFLKLSLDEQKRMFLTMLDLNQMYVQKTEMEDKRFGINEKDQQLTNQFYNSEK